MSLLGFTCSLCYVDVLLTNLSVKHTLILNIPFLAPLCVCLVTSHMFVVVGGYTQTCSPSILWMFSC